MDYSCGYNGSSAERVQGNFQSAVDDQPNRLYPPIVSCQSGFLIRLQLKSSKSSKRSQPNWTSFVNDDGLVIHTEHAPYPPILYWLASQLSNSQSNTYSPAFQPPYDRITAAANRQDRNQHQYHHQQLHTFGLVRSPIPTPPAAMGSDDRISSRYITSVVDYQPGKAGGLST